MPAEPRHYLRLPHTAVKAAVLPFGIPGVDTSGPRCGRREVMGIDADPGRALAKALVASGASLPREGTIFLSVANGTSWSILYLAKRMADLGFRLLATRVRPGCSNAPASPSRGSPRSPRADARSSI